jgi:hypothetical protein
MEFHSVAQAARDRQATENFHPEKVKGQRIRTKGKHFGKLGTDSALTD